MVPRRTRTIPTYAAISLCLAAGAHFDPLAAQEVPDRRSVEIFRYSCASEFGRHELTLFMNGTVRLREGTRQEPSLALDELGPEALEDNLRVLRGAYSERGPDRIRQPLAERPGLDTSGLDGHWVERCEIYLALPEMNEPLRYEFSSYEPTPLRISRLIHIADELAAGARPVEPESERLPEGYEPRFGDVLRDSEGTLYMVLRLTADRRGVELRGVEQPLNIYVALEAIHESFVSIEKRGDDAWWWRR